MASYRSDDLHRRHPLRRQVAEWSRLRGVDRVQLGPLGDDQVRLLIASLSPGAIGEKELAAIVRRAEGNAFFVEELVGAADRPGSWVPDDLADVLLVRLDRLDDAARQVVRAASVAGRRVAHDLLAAVAGLPAAELEEGLRQAVEMNVLVPGDGTYSFRHALLGEAVYDDLLPGERVRLHAQYAEALREGRAAARPPSWPGTPGWRTTSTPPSTPASAPATRRWPWAAPTRPLTTTSRRSSCWPTRPAAPRVDVDLSKLAVSAADALDQLGPADPGRGAARRAARPARRRRVRRRGGPGCSRPAPSALMLTESVDEEPASTSPEAVALLPEDVSGLRAKVLATHARVLSGYGRYDEAQAAGLDALALAEKLDLHELASDVDHDPERAQEGRAQGGPPRGPGRGGRPRRRDRRHPGRAAGPLLPRPLLRGLGRVGAGGDVVPQRHEGGRGGRASPGRRTASSPAGSWPGSRASTATGTRRCGWPTPATSRRRRSLRRCSRRSRCWSRPGAASRSAERARALRRFWELEGGVASTRSSPRWPTPRSDDDAEPP